MVEVLVILDGASEPLGDRPTSLELARTPTLDRLAAEGRLSRLRTVPARLPAGSETAIPGLLGWTPAAPVDRGLVEAAAQGIPLADGEHAWRVDAVEEGGVRAGPERARRAAEELRRAAPGHRVHRLEGNRLLLVGPRPFPAELPAGLRHWPEGTVPPRILDTSTVVVSARGAAAGLGRLLGADVVVPAGATGRLDTDLAAKASAAVAALDGGAARVVLHYAAPDEAAHERNRSAKIRAVERADAELLPPLAEYVRRSGGVLLVCSDHGCDPDTGIHDSEPVPHLRWGADGRSGTARRFTERDAAAADRQPTGVA